MFENLHIKVGWDARVVIPRSLRMHTTRVEAGRNLRLAFQDVQACLSSLKMLDIECWRLDKRAAR